MEALIAIAVVLLLLFLAWFFFFRGPGVAGTISGGASPTNVVDRWVTAPNNVPVGVRTTFVFQSDNNNPAATSGPQLAPITSRAVGFTVTPGQIQIVSINGASVNGTTGTGNTGTNGQISVVIIANSVPPVLPPDDLPKGALIAIPVADTSVQKKAEFTVDQ